MLVSNLSNIRSKASVPMRAPPEKGCSMAPMVNSTSPITPAKATTISLCAHVFSSPNRYVKPTTAIPAKINTPQDGRYALVGGHQAHPPRVGELLDLVQPFCVERLFGRRFRLYLL